MPFTPLSPQLLTQELANWIVDLPGEHPAVGVDGAREIGAAALADTVAERVMSLGRPVLRASTQWWWRPASLRLELGRTDVDTLLYGWVDTGSIRRELFEPLAPGGSGLVLRRLRDPGTDRSVRASPDRAQDRAVVVLDGPFLLAAEVPLDHVVHLQVSPGAIARALPAERAWWLPAFDRYRRENQPEQSADVVVSYDHPGSPAVRWAADR